MAKNSCRAPSAALISVLLLGAASCAPLFDRPKPVEISPVETPSADGVTADDSAYRSAATAIEDRDYALALEYLQAARERQPRDVRVLNGFGVVYDKLGRFDLSARYYAQAKAIDPHSTIVLANISYSHALQGLENHEPATGALADATALRRAAAPPEPAPEPRAAANTGSASFTPVAAGLAAQPDVHFGDAGLGAAPPPAQLPAQHSALAAVQPALRVSPEDAQFMVSAVPAAELPAQRSAQALIHPALRVSPEDVQFGASDAPAVQSPAPASVARAPAPTVRPDHTMTMVHASPPQSPTIHAAAARPDQVLTVVRASSPQSPPVRAAAIQPESSHRIAQLESPRPMAAGIPGGVLAPKAVASNRPLLTGHPLSIVNASGKKGATDAIRRRLVHLGWTAPRWAARDGAGASHTTLFYARPYAGVARALARTLRFSIHLASRSCGCGGLELVVGTDFLRRSAFADNLEPGRNDPGGAADPTTSKELDHVPAKA